MILPSFGTPAGRAFSTSFSGSQENICAPLGGEARHTAAENIARSAFMSFPFTCKGVYKAEAFELLPFTVRSPSAMRHSRVRDGGRRLLKVGRDPRLQ